MCRQPLVALPAVLLAAALSSSCGKPTCPAGDLECLWASFTVVDNDATTAFSSPRLKLYAVDTGPLIALGVRDAAAGGSNASGAFTVTLSQDTTHESAQASAIIALVWADPTGCRPSFCYSACPKGVRCLSRSWCTPSIGDGAFRGIATHRVEYEKAPEAPAGFGITVTPVASPGCPEDITGLVSSSSTTVRVGTPGTTQVYVPGTQGGGGTGGGSGTGGGTGGLCDGVVGTVATCLPSGAPGGCNCVGSTTAACVPASEFRNAGLPVPSACTATGQSGCWDAATNAVARPCCSGSCRVANSCNGPSNGVCQ